MGGDAALFILGGAQRHGAVLHAPEGGNRQIVALLGVDGHQDILDDVGHIGAGRLDGGAGQVLPLGLHLHLHQGVDAGVHGGDVHVDHLFALETVGLFHGGLHVLHGVLHGDDISQLEERRLQHHVGPVAQTQGLGFLIGVDDVEMNVVFRDIAQDVAGDVLLQLVLGPLAVQQEAAVGLQLGDDVVLGQIGLVVAGHKVGGGHQIGAADGLIAEAQVALGQAAGLHGVIGEVSLSVLAAHEADGGDGVLVGAHGAVAAQTPDLAGNLAGMGELHVLIGQRGVGHIVVDADGEVVLRLSLLQIVIHGDDLAGGGVLGAETVTAAHHADVAAAGLIQSCDNVQVHGLAHGAGLLVAVQHSDPLAGGGDGGGEVLHGEGTEQMNLHHAHLAALSVQIVHSLLHGLAGGAHHHDDFLRVGRAIVIEQLVVPAGDFIDLVHVVLHGTGHDGTLDVSALLALEVHVGVHVVAPVGGMLRVQGLMAEGLQCLLIHQTTEILIVQSLDPLHLVGGTEAVKAVHEGIPAADGGQMSHGGQIHCLLRAGGHQHGIAGHTAGHEVRMVAEDRVMVGGHHAGRNVHDAGQELAAHGVHGGDHQHQALGGGEAGGQSTGLQCAVTCAAGAGLGLHLHQADGLAEDVLFSVGGPFVGFLRHGGRRGDGIDARYLGKGIGNIGGGFVAVTDFQELAHIGSSSHIFAAAPHRPPSDLYIHFSF